MKSFHPKETHYEVSWNYELLGEVSTAHGGLLLRCEQERVDSEQYRIALPDTCGSTVAPYTESLALDPCLATASCQG